MLDSVDIQLLQSIALAINESPDFEAALSVVLQRVCSQTGWDAGEVWLPSADAKVLEASPVWYSCSPTLQGFRDLSELLTFASGVGFPGRVWATGQPEWQTDLSHQAHCVFHRAAVAGAFGLETAVGIPILMNHHVLGVIIFFTTEKRSADQRLVELMLAIVSHLGTVTRLNQTEAALWESQRRLTALIDALPGIVFSCGNDPDWSMTYLSEGCFKLTGYTSDELVGPNRAITYNDITHVDDLQPLLDAIQTAIQQQQPYVVEYRIQTKQGEEKWLWEKGNGVVGPNGQILGLEGFITEITERKQVEAALSASEARFRTMFESSAMGIGLSDLNGYLVEVNSASLELFGYSADEFLGLHFNAYTHPDDIDVGQALYQELISGQRESYQIEKRYIHKSGSIFWGRVTVSAMCDRQGEMLWTFGMVEDITQRKQAEAALHRSDERFNRLVTNVPGMMFQFCLQPDGNMSFPYVSSGCQELCELESGTMQDHAEAIWDLIHAGDWGSFQTSILSSAKWLQPWQWEGRIVTPSGRLKWIQGIARPEQQSNGDIFWDGVFTDITPLKQTERALQEKEAFMRLILDNIPQHIFWKDRDFIYRGANKNWYDASGFTVSEVIGNTDYDLWSQDKADHYRRNDLEVMDNNTPKMHMLRHKIRADGREIWQAVSKVPIHNSDGQVVGILGTSEDITDRKLAEEALRQAEEKYRSIFENVVEGIFQTTPDGQYTTVNPMLAKIYGYDSPHDLMANLTDIQHQLYVDPGRRDVFIQQLQEQDVVWGFESEIYRRDGSIIWISENARVLRDSCGQLVGFEGTVEDITERKQAEAELQRRDVLLQGVADATRCLLTNPDYDEAIAQALATLGEAVGVDRVYIYENHLHPETGGLAMSMRFEWTASDVPSSIEQDHWQNQPYNSTCLERWYSHLSDGLPISGITSDFPAVEQELLQRDRIMAILMVPIFTQKRFWGYIGFDDCHTERRWAKSEESILVAIATSLAGVIQRRWTEEMMRYQAFHDLLTGLPNRSLFSDRLVQAITAAQRKHSMMAVMFLDLDRFKIINDTLGHAVGDCLLKSATRRLVSALRDSDTLARWGGDEFTLLLPEISCIEDAARVSQRILDAMKPAFHLEGHELYVTSSIGIALYPQNGVDSQTLLKNADAALYLAKEKGRNNCQFYSTTINSQASELLTLDNSLHHALDRNEFVIHYQPQINITTGAITQIEALLRWQHPQLGLVSPQTFIALAEENGLIVPIGEWVLQMACAQTKQWHAAGLTPLRIAVNLSARQFQQPRLVQRIEQILSQAGLAPTCLELEITETAAMRDVDFTTAILHDLRDMGVRIAMDDFGTGYSSLNYLKKFPLHALKIDRSFVQDLTDNPNDAAIITSIIALGHGLNLSVVAEGVETQAQLERLRSLQCEEMQGYWFSRPLTPAAATDFLVQHWQQRSSVTVAQDGELQIGKPLG